MEKKDLEKELFSSFRDTVYKKISLIELLIIDRKYLFKKIKHNELSIEASRFLLSNQQKIENIYETISIEYFRKQRCLELLYEYCDKHKTCKNGKNSKVQEKPSKNNAKEKTRAIIQSKKTDKPSIIEEYIADTMMPTSLNKPDRIDNNHQNIKTKPIEEKKNKKNIKKNKKQAKSQNTKLKNQNTAIEYVLNILLYETQNGKLNWRIEKYNDNRVKYTKYIALSPSSAGDGVSINKVEYYDDSKYVLHINHSNIICLDIGLLESAIRKQKPEESIAYSYIEINEKIKKREEQALLKQSKKRKSKKQIEREYIQPVTKEIVITDTVLADQKRQILESSQKDDKRNKGKNDSIKKEIYNNIIAIGIKDFLVRRSVFKCMHNQHKIENIVAVINIIDNKNEERSVRINAGYCPICKIFFIMESTYANLKNQGIPICRVSDEKTYLKNYSINGMKLAQESILMQYGYNVNQSEGLSSTRRQKILAVLIDKDILSKSEIISYLDFFIGQRQMQSRFQVAISKWEDDREFVENYKIGEYHQYGVNALYRK